MVYILYYPAEDNRAIEVTTSASVARQHQGLVGLVLDVDHKLYSRYGCSGASLLAAHFDNSLWTAESGHQIDATFRALNNLRSALG